MCAADNATSSDNLPVVPDSDVPWCSIMPQFKITTLGCKVNQYDGQAIAQILESAGFRPAENRDQPPVDLVVVNTCCVTATAMRKSRQTLRRAVRQAPGAAVLVAGCYGDYDAQRIRALLAELNVPPDRLAFAGHHGHVAEQVRRFARHVHRDRRRTTEPRAQRRDTRAGLRGDDVWMSASRDARIIASPESIRTRRQAAVKNQAAGAAGLGPIERFAGHQRAFVKVQDGCDAFCAYCIVPYTRPNVRSRPAEEVLRECRNLVAAGHKEIVLCGVFLGAYGRPTTIRRRWGTEPSSLGDLVRAVAGIEGLWRVRLSSIEPGDVTDALLDVLANTPTVAPHLHLPMQSGSAKILRRMNRQYTADEYRHMVDRVRSALDRPAITTDVIVGFPGEGDEDFAATLDVARFAGFAKIHAFPFSAVEGTAAWTYRDEAPAPGVVKARMTELAELEDRLAETYRRQFVGRTMEGLVEAAGHGATNRRAMTDRYLTVTFPRPAGQADDDLTGQVVRLRIDEVTAHGLAGTILA